MRAIDRPPIPQYVHRRMSDPLRTSSLPEKDMQRVAEIFRQRGTLCAQILPSSAVAHIAWALRDALSTPCVWVTDGPKTLDVFYQDLVALGQGRTDEIGCFAPWESLPGHGAPPPADLIGDRLATLQRCLSKTRPLILVTSIQALMLKTIAPETLRKDSMEVRVGQETDLTHALAALEQAGYELLPEVQAKGQAAHRGGILDVWPPMSPWPARLEWFGSTIESLRWFDPVEQRSLEKIDRITLSPATEQPESMTGDFLMYLPPEINWAWVDRQSIEHHAGIYEEFIAESNSSALTIALETIKDRIAASFRGGQLSFSLESAPGQAAVDFGIVPFEGPTIIQGKGPAPDLLNEARDRLARDLQRRCNEGWTIRLYFGTEGARERFHETYGRLLEVNNRFTTHLGALSDSFACEPLRLLILSEADFYGRRKQVRSRYDQPARAAARAGERIAEWTDIQPGDLVVHIDHGIGKYLGLYEIEFNGKKQEVLTIEYAEKARLFLPVSQTHLLSRYVGVGRRRPELHALGGRRWQRERIAAEQAVQDLAAALLETQAARDALDGHAFAPDTPWQQELEASFPYHETPDQAQAIADVKRDMESRRPMDRLVCGDVGYGKTEVAMRAAFKAVMDGKQVALLVPTTVLAQQHFDTFTTRMAAYPVRIEMLSRFQTRREQMDILDRLADGAVDIVIGTHRLVQDDVSFKDLGLVIIDEEQRFGVKQKEHFKQMRKLVDVLTLTATPIPRTLYMSLTGARDLSTIQTPPVERMPIETIVTQNTDEVVREAILNELNREGQVYYLHNRVQSIEHVYERLRRLVPEARIDVAHGQMNEKHLAAIMRAFIQGAFDVLLCTTIIESGLDIPNVNTILIDRADRFGMADLYQLRGRVGRYKRKAYAYLLLPRHGQLFDVARRRIGALKRYSHLGAGFKLALRDLELRGAGNLLGAEQSGHIAAIGFDLYCQLLKRTVAQLKGETLPPIVDVEVNLDFIDLSPAATDEERAAALPSSYVEDESLRVGLYRKIAGAVTRKEIDALRKECRDRFGPLPPPVERLIKISELRIAAAGKSVRKIEVEGDKIILTRHGDLVMPGGKFPRLHARTSDARLDEILRVLRNLQPK